MLEYLGASIVVISFVINAAIFAVDVYPFLRGKYFSRIQGESSITLTAFEFQKRLVSASEAMALSGVLTLPRTKPAYATQRIIGIFRRAIKQAPGFSFAMGYLLAGLSDYALAKRDRKLLDLVKRAFEPVIRQSEQADYKFSYIDEAVFGLAAINLYRESGDERYKKFADGILKSVREYTGADIIPYSRGEEYIILSDTIGMICPFLSRYGQYFNSSVAVELGFRQISYFMQHAVDPDSALPFHAYDRQKNIRLGPTNWGRGIGWYILGVSQYTKLAGKKSEQIERLFDSLRKIESAPNVWAQFPGTSGDFDSSATAMIIFGMHTCGYRRFSVEEVAQIFAPYTSDGVVQCSSGETRYVNQYSDAFGPSELTQGIILMALAAMISSST